MSNIIDAFFITLGLDDREYEKKRKEVNASLKKFGDASAKQTKLIAEHGKKAASAFSALKIEILGALAAFGMGAGFKSFIESSINGQAQLGRMSGALGISIKSLQAWRGVAMQVGSSGDVAAQALQKVSDGLAAARRGDTTFLTTANKYGAADEHGNILGLNDNVESAMHKLNVMAFKIRQKYGEQQAISILGQLGISDFNLQTEMTKSPDALARDYADAMREIGGVTGETSAKAQEMQKQWGLFQLKMEAIRNKVFDKLEPILIKLGTQFADWVNSVDWDKVIDQIGKFLGQLNKLINALGGVKGVLLEIAAIKVFGWAVSIAGWVIKLKSLTGALFAARAAAAAGAAGAAAGGTGAAAAGAGEAAATGGSAGLLARAIPWALPIWALFHSESTGGKRRADGTYEDEVDWNSPEQQAGIARQKAAQDKAVAQTFSSLESKYDLPSGLLDSVYSAESSRGKHLVSPKGALGPFQFMPATAAQYGLKGSDVNDTGKAADAAARYLHNLIAQFNGNVPEAIAAYNWGPGNVQRKGMGALPQETSDYISKVLGSMSGYVGARTESPKSGNSASTNSVTINGPINVQTKATDANGIAMGLGNGLREAFRDNPLIAGSVTALA